MANKTFLPENLFYITNGPGKFDLMCSNFDFKTVFFTCLCDSKEIKVEGRILFCCPEDGSKERWIGKIILVNPKHSNYKSDSNIALTEERVYYYDSKTRKGYIFESNKKWEMGG